MGSSVVATGLDQIDVTNEFNGDHRYGVLTNSSSVNRDGLPIFEALLEAGLSIKIIFSPEHGIHSKGIDGQYQQDATYHSGQIPIISLYGDQLKPSPEHLKNIDAIIIDLPNIGSRCYTYLWTMSYMLDICNTLNLKIIILDRPNPLGGIMEYCEGPIMQPACFSFIGHWSVPIRFGLTLGELALLLKKEKKLTHLDLTIVRAEGWRRVMTALQYQYPFVAPSPAITSIQTMFTYPALCFLEATNVSEGRGTPFPFQMIIAPWIDSVLLKREIDEMHLAGVAFELIQITPAENKYKQQLCHGLKLLVTDTQAIKPIKTGFILIAILKSLFPQQFQWNSYPTLANPDGKNHLLKLIGDHPPVSWLMADPLNHLDRLDQWLQCPGWAERCRSILLYD